MGKGKTITYTDEQRLKYGLACVEKWPHYFKMFCNASKKKKDPNNPETIIHFFGWMKNRLTGKKNKSFPKPNSAMERLGYENNGHIFPYKLQ